MSKQKLPRGWDEARIQRLIDHYETIDEDTQLKEDEAARAAVNQTLIAVPTTLLPAIRALIARTSPRNGKKKRSRTRTKS